ncbi:hypothetical protein QBC39DRAFT_356242 [Podospora conica]|nr:hypothetical protein QBC39DRAFT_356242 [Schizothecium conicum]
MRRVSSPLRQLVQSRLKTLPRPRLSDEPSPATTLRRPTELNACLSAYSTIPPWPTSYSITTPASPATTTTKGWSHLPPGRPYNPAPQSAPYGKWEFLRRDKARLLVETKVEAPNQSPALLVDLPENHNDFQLWLCILDFRRHEDGLAGAAAVLEGLMQRGSLTEMEGESAVIFWKTILADAYRHKGMLDDIWIYAEWLYTKYGTRWPNLYETIVTRFVEKDDRTRALRWHLRLSPNLGPDVDTFIAMLKRLMDPAPERQEILRMLYLASPRRCLYDEIVPFLYSKGQAEIARRWRALFVANGDVPIPHSSGSYPFLRYFSAYHYNERLEPSERMVVRRQAVAQEVDQGAKPAHLGLRHMVNAAHGEVFGIKETTYDDKLGARWFATAWVSIDSAISSLVMLGITCIGPLSLQSIALRELTAEGLARRIEQLQDSGISVGDSTYTQALSLWAASGDEDMIRSLIHSDMHPDVFENPAMQRSVAHSARRTGDVARYRLIAAARSAVVEDLAKRWSNQVLLGSLLVGNKVVTLRLLDTMHRRGIQLSVPTVRAISGHLRRTVSAEPTAEGDSPPDVLFYACLCSMITSMLAPPSVEVLHHIFFQLLHQGQGEEFKQLARDVIGYYQRRRDAGHGFLSVFEESIPERLRDIGDEARGSGLRQIPHDLDLRHSMHPLSLIFDRHLQHAIVIQSFVNYNATARVKGQPPPSRLWNFRFLDGIHRLGWLWQQGVIHRGRVLRKALILALSECDARTRILQVLCPSRVKLLLSPTHQMMWSLQALRQMVHQIFGSKDVLPSALELRQSILQAQSGSEGYRWRRVGRRRKTRGRGRIRGEQLWVYSRIRVEDKAKVAGSKLKDKQNKTL